MNAASTPAAAIAVSNNVELEQTRREILEGLSDKIRSRRIPIHYRLGLLAVTFVMMLLPLVYVGLIGLASWLLYLHATSNVRVLSEVHDARAALFLYAVPLIAGGAMVIFMIKPLFAKAPKRAEPLPLDPKSQRFLFEYVHRICAAVGAPRPREIRVDCQANASASFRHGLWSIFGNDLVLTLGLPLVSDLSLQQLSGVIAHEFGHFAQHAGMRLTVIVRTVNFWFARVVFERDSWDQALIELCDTDYRIAVIFYLARFFVWLTRRILWVLMMFGHIVSCYMLRQMEYDADYYETKLAGSDGFEATANKLIVLQVATARAYSSLGRAWSEKRLPDDVPGLIHRSIDKVEPEIMEKSRTRLQKLKTKWLDTHPSNADRVHAAQALAAPAMFSSARPAAIIFDDFESVSRRATQEYYREILGKQFRTDYVCPLDDLMQREDADTEAGKVFSRFMRNCDSEIRTLNFPAIVVNPPESLETAAAALHDSRAQMTALAPGYCAKLKDRIESEKRNADLGGAAIKNYLITQKRKKAEELRAAAEIHLTPYETSAGARLIHALSLLTLEPVAAKMADADALLSEARRLLPISVHIGKLMPKLAAIRSDLMLLIQLTQRFKGNEKNSDFAEAFRVAVSNVRRDLVALSEGLGIVDYPFEHSSGKVRLSHFLKLDSVVPNSSESWDFVPLAAEALDKLEHVHTRLLGRLATTAEKAEAAIDLAPLPEEPSAKELKQSATEKEEDE